MLIGQAIKTLRKKRGFSQEGLAKLSGLSQCSISSIEIGKKNPEKNTLEKISKALDIPVDIIFMYGLEVKDVKPKNRGTFELLNHSIKGLIESYVENLNSNPKDTNPK